MDSSSAPALASALARASRGPRSLRLVAPALLALAMAGCAVTPRSDEADALLPAQARELALQVIPAGTPDRNGWATDLYAALSTLDVPATPSNLCAVMAVTEQESSWRADPRVPGLAKIAREEIDERADKAGVPAFAVAAALSLKSPDGRSYSERLDKATTERELSEIFEDFIGMVPLGRTFLASRNPVRTGGPMQVSIAFAEQQVGRKPYPYPIADSVRREVFTRRGGLYFGAAHLLDYTAPYSEPLYRFADFNAGRWASRNAGFQNAVSTASGIPLALDGDLLLPDSGGERRQGQTELAVNALAARLEMTSNEIRRDLERASGDDFERSTVYRRVFELAEARNGGKPLPRAVIPRIRLESPKITRQLTTEWFATRVDGRYRKCMERAKGLAAG